MAPLTPFLTLLLWPRGRKLGHEGGVFGDLVGVAHGEHADAEAVLGAELGENPNCARHKSYHKSYKSYKS